GTISQPPLRSRRRPNIALERMERGLRARRAITRRPGTWGDSRLPPAGLTPHGVPPSSHAAGPEAHPLAWKLFPTALFDGRLINVYSGNRSSSRAGAGAGARAGG